MIVVWSLVFFPQLFQGQRFVLGDAAEFLPFSDFSRARWTESRERTYWNPYVLMGVEAVASLADPRPQYLPDPLLDLADRLGRPRFAPQSWLLLAHLAGALATMALAGRMLGASPWSAAAAALAWLLAVTSLLPFTFGHDAQLVADALLPVVALGTQVVVSARTRASTLAGALAVALGLGLQTLHGHPQIVVYTAVLALALAIHQAHRSGSWWRLGAWAGAAGLGAALGAAVWWPALLYGSQSLRGPGEGGLSLAEVAKFSLGFRDLASLVWPHAVGYGGSTYWGNMNATDYSPYLGAVLVVFAVRGVMSRAPGTRFLGIVAALAALHALGTTLGPLYALVHQVPLWNKFRVPFYTLIVSSLALALLAAKGIDALVAGSARARRAVPRAWWLGCAGLAALGLAIAWSPLRALYGGIALATRERLDPARALDAAAVAGGDLVLRAALVAAALALATLRSPRLAALRGPAIALLLAVDLGSITVPALMRASGPASEVAPPPPVALARTVAAEPHVRAYVGIPDPIPEPRLGTGQYLEPYTNFWIAWRARCLTGNHGAVPAAWRPVVRHQMTRSATVLAAWGVGYLDLAPQVDPGPGLRLVAEDPRSRVYALDSARGRAYAAPLVVAVADADQVARAMMRTSFDPSAVALTTEPGVAGEYPGSAACAIRWQRDDPEHVVLETESAERAFLVLADTHAPGWTARVDGAPAALVRTNLLTRGLALTAGRHVVEMRYTTPGMRAGVAATRIALAVVLALALVCAALAMRERGRARAPA